MCSGSHPFISQSLVDTQRQEIQEMRVKLVEMLGGQDGGFQSYYPSCTLAHQNSSHQLLKAVAFH